MDIRALRYFIALVEQQSFTAASASLHVTQPTISKMVRNLEQDVGQPLLHREGRRFWLTDAGEVVYQRAQSIMAEFEQLNTELDDLNQLDRGQLRLGMPPMIGPLYANVLREYRRRYPNVALSIVEYGGRRTEQALINGEIDVAITMLTDTQPECLQSLPLQTHPIYAVLPNQAAWREQKSLTWQAVKDEPFYLYSAEFTLSDRIIARCEEHGYQPTIAARSSQWDFLASLVKSGAGVAFLPAPLCQRLSASLEDSELLLVKPISPAIEWQLGLVWHGERYVSRTAEAWMQLCQSTEVHR